LSSVFVYNKRFPLTRIFVRAKRLLSTLFVEMETLSMPNATVRANAPTLPEASQTAKDFILRELDACERRLREIRTKAEAISGEDA
jgi:hypothetical protein